MLFLKLETKYRPKMLIPFLYTIDPFMYHLIHKTNKHIMFVWICIDEIIQKFNIYTIRILLFHKI